MRKGIGKESKSLWEYTIYLDFTSQVQGNTNRKNVRWLHFDDEPRV